MIMDQVIPPVLASDLTMRRLAAIYKAITPPLFYIVDERVDEGRVYWQGDQGFPRFFGCHPNDVEKLKKGIAGRRLVNVRDDPKCKDMVELWESEIEDLEEKLNEQD